MKRIIHLGNFENTKYVLIGTIVFIIALIAHQSACLTKAQSTSLPVDLPPLSLTVVGLNGTQVVLDSVDIGNLPFQRGLGGWKNSIGTIRGPDNYTGVTIVTLCDLVGGLDNNTIVRVTASDNYSKTLNFYEAVEGDFITYDPSTGNPVIHNATLTPIVAYFKNDLNLTADEGPLRLAIIGTENVVTDSKYWVKFVVKLEVLWGHDVAITNVAPEKSVVGQGYTCNTNITVLNKGGYAETFIVSLCMNGTQVQNQSITLPRGSSSFLSQMWNTTGFDKGNYTVSVLAGPVFGETEIYDNLLVNGSIYVGLVGDMNGDRKVDIRDISFVARRFGMTPSHPLWDPVADVNEDNKIDIKDVSIVAKHFGEATP